MQLIRVFEGIRNPVLDILFLNITKLGEEWVFIAVGLAFLWCINKKTGYFLLTAGIFGNLSSVLLKSIFRVSRPWLVDNGVSVVEGAKAAAIGYSFPSGHSLNAAVIFGGAARISKGFYRFFFISLVLLTGFSRIYLGVHTFIDVAVGLFIGFLLILILHPMFFNRNKNLFALRLFGVAAALITPFIVALLPKAVPEFDLQGIMVSYKMMGAAVALLLCWEYDEKFINYKTDAVFWAQALKLITGLLLCTYLRAALKVPFSFLLHESPLADATRYFVITIFAAGIWPLTFKYFARLGKK